MIVTLRSSTGPGVASAIGINTWCLKSTGSPSSLCLQLPDTEATSILMAHATGPTELAQMAADLSIGAVSLSAGEPAHSRVLSVLRVARERLSEEGRILDAVSLRLAAVVLTPDLTGVIAVSGQLPVYLIADGYAARVDPDVALGNEMLVRDLALTRGQQLLLADEPLEDKGIALDWPSAYGASAVERLAAQAQRIATDSGAGCCLAGLSPQAG